MSQLESRDATDTDDELVVGTDTAATGEHTVRSTRWMLVGLAAVVAAVIGFLALSGDGNDGELEAVSAPEQTTTTAADSTTTVATAPQGPATFVADATLYIDENSPIEEGTYRVDTLGTPFSVTVGEGLFVQPNRRGQFVLTHQSSQGPDDRDIVMLRLSSLSDPAQPDFGLDTYRMVWPTDLGEGWPADDFSDWLDNLSDQIVVSNRQDTILGGLEATRVDLYLGETACSTTGSFCMLFGSNHQIDTKMLNLGSTYRIWVVDQDNQDPLAVIVGINREADRDWFDTADAILSTLAFGEIAPNPMELMPAGQVELPFLGGIRTELAEQAVAFRNLDSHSTIRPAEWPADTDFLASPVGYGGNVLDTPDNVVTELEDSGLVVIEIESVVIDGIDARVFDIAGNSSRPSLKRTTDDNTGWWAPARGRTWLIDHPDRGLLMITSEAFTDVDNVFPIILAQTESIIESLEFIDLE